MGPQCLLTPPVSASSIYAAVVCVGGLGSVCFIWSTSPVLFGVLCESKCAFSNSLLISFFLSEDLSPRTMPQDYLKPTALFESSIKLITMHIHHPVKFNINILSLLPHKLHAFPTSHSGRTTHVIACLQVYLNIMVIISIFGHKSVSTNMSCVIIFTDTIALCLDYFVFLTFRKFSSGLS
jgi:hypothetical protein